MSENRKLAENVSKFLFDAADIVARIKSEQFSQNVFCELLESGVESPIEDIFYIACHVWCINEYIELNPSHIFNKHREIEDGCGIFIEPQKQIGKFRVDFLISQNGIGPAENLTPVIVELDGHDFHDKDKHQRSYEKSRDRFFVKEGYKVLHFTGSDVISDPYKASYEALCLVGLGSVMGRSEYDKKNPFGFE
jgi:very-short-patch-repair endonuclease